MTPPELRTPRLTLRPPSADDYATYVRFYSDPEASASYAGPLDAAQAWRKLAYDIGHWSLRGFGMFSVMDRESGDMLGGCGVVHPEGWPRHELTWWIMPAARRRGVALEASQAVLDWAYGTLGWDLVETHMNDENKAARALAQKLGGQVIDRITFPDGLQRDIYRLPRSAPA